MQCSERSQPAPYAQMVGGFIFPSIVALIQQGKFFVASGKSKGTKIHFLLEMLENNLLLMYFFVFLNSSLCFVS